VPCREDYGQSSRPSRLVSSRLSLNRPACRETNLLAVALASAVRGGDWAWDGTGDW
jgi:hypothetical protein